MLILKKYRIIKYLNLFILILIILSISMYFKIYVDENSNKYIKSFSSYLKKENVSLIEYKNKNIKIEKENITIKSYKDFNLIEKISFDNILVIEKNNDILNNIYDYITIGLLVKSNVSEIKTMLNKIQSVEIDNISKMDGYYKDYYPYYVRVCDFKIKVSINKFNYECDIEDNFNLTIDSNNKKYKLIIDNYTEWDKIVDNYMKINSVSIFNKIEDQKKAF